MSRKPSYNHLTPRTPRKRFDRGLGAYRLAEALMYLQPATNREIAEYLGVTREAVVKMMARLRFGDTPIAPVRIAGWADNPIGPRAPQYAFGVGGDAKKTPRSGAISAKLYRDRKRDKYGAVEAAKKAGPAGYFEGLMR
jgi:hypothetical protein